MGICKRDNLLSIGRVSENLLITRREVLNTTSPLDLPCAPIAMPLKILPSANARTASRVTSHPLQFVLPLSVLVFSAGEKSGERKPHSAFQVFRPFCKISACFILSELYKSLVSCVYLLGQILQVSANFSLNDSLNAVVPVLNSLSTNRCR